MNWRELLSAKRFGLESLEYIEETQIRSQFQRDYDRLIFSSPFRRLQNKTQVFPLPERIFVHNRLTHSLEVASVGKSLGRIISDKIIAAKIEDSCTIINEIGSIVSAACLAHDLGNPPFGHSGEEAISSFFREGEGKRLESRFNKDQWHNMTNFEGNANAFRVLTHSFKGRREGGFGMTYATLASIVKYPFESTISPKGKKYGYFYSEIDSYKKVADELGIPVIKTINNKEIYARHPLVYLVEAADDICYQIMDIEDAHKLNILSTERSMKLLMNFFSDAPETVSKIKDTFNIVTDTNEQIAYLRAYAINKLVVECADLFWKNYDDIMAGSFVGSLIDSIPQTSKEAYKECSRVAFSEIYKAKVVVEIDTAGFKILGKLLQVFTEALEYPDRFYSKNILSLIPKQFDVVNGDFYQRVQSITDHISGMTDSYALDLYRTIEGIHLPR